MEIVIDSSVLVGLLVPNDLWHPQAVALWEAIKWILPDVPHLYLEGLDLIRSSSGALNFNDALIALACRERGIPAIASFDADFDQVAWLRRLARPKDVTP